MVTRKTACTTMSCCPTPYNCSNGNVNDAGAFPPSSRHSGGVNALMGDGSVRFIKQTIATQAMVGDRHPQRQRDRLLRQLLMSWIV